VGASWVREHILDEYRSAKLAVIVVWEPMYPGDTRQDAVEDKVFGDPRVTSFWDPHEISGRWFGERALGNLKGGQIVWDAYYAFGPAARWDRLPDHLLTSGAPIIGGTDALKRYLIPVLDGL
jgi:hypothetical protein